MSFVSTLRQWDEAVAYVDKQDLSEALNIFLCIEEPNSKIAYNIGCLHLLNQDLDAAEKAFDCSICKDEHLAVAFFQRGLTFFKKERFEESLSDFQQAFRELRGNQLIDYKALGLRYKLYACEVLHNMALAQAQMGQWEKAQESLVKALNYKTEAKLNLIDRALQSILRQRLFKPVEVPARELFKPNKHYVAELEKRDYLGKAKVVASIIPQDEFSGFAPLQPQVEDAPAGPKTPEVLRALEGVPHTVLFEFSPETSDELAVVPGNIVFVLQKGTDNWASVIFNERRGLVPYSYLERLDLTISSKQKRDGNNGGEPPRRKPPTRPERKSALTPTPKSTGNSEPEAPTPKSTGNSEPEAEPEAGEPSLCIVKVHYTYNMAISILPGSPYTTVLDKISEKLQLPATAITLSFTAETTGKTVIDSQTEMGNVWSSASSGRLTLWCDIKEGIREQQQNLAHLVALYSYKSTNPEDLTFNQGDTITLLSKVNQDWLEGQCNGNTGIFPASFVEEVPVNGQQESV